MSLYEERFDQMFPVLDAASVAAARRFASGEAVTFAPGQLVYDVGTRNSPAWLVLDGNLEVMRRDGLHRESSVISLSAGQFSGEVSQLSGHGTIAAGRAGAKGLTALPYDAAHIRALMVGSAELGEVMMRAFILRRVALIQEGGSGSLLIGHPNAPDLLRLQGFLSRNGYPYSVLNVEADEEARAAVRALRRARKRTAADDLPERCVPETADRRRGRRLSRHHAGARSRQDLRRRRGRRRSGRTRRRGLRRIGRPVDDRARSARLRRPGRRLGAHRELSRLSDRHFRHGLGRPRLQPGAEIRRRDRHSARGREARLRRRRARRAVSYRHQGRRQRGAGAHRDHRIRRALPAAGDR